MSRDQTHRLHEQPIQTSESPNQDPRSTVESSARFEVISSKYLPRRNAGLQFSSTVFGSVSFTTGPSRTVCLIVAARLTFRPPNRPQHFVSPVLLSSKQHRRLPGSAPVRPVGPRAAHSGPSQRPSVSRGQHPMPDRTDPPLSIPPFTNPLTARYERRRTVRTSR